MTRCRTRRAGSAAVAGAALAVLLALAACGSTPPTPGPTPSGNRPVAPATGGRATSWTATPRPPAQVSPYSKVMVIAEENEPESSVIGSSQAPYLTKLAATYGQATNMQAGYPTACPSLAAYILMTSGSQQGICDDEPPANHQLSGDNIFKQVTDAGLEWREYAESMPQSCRTTNSSDGLYLVRHAPPPYYTSESGRCDAWDVPLGTTTSGALHAALATGLPSYSFVTPNACNDMHGAPSCQTTIIKSGDNWLAKWMPQIIASDDFQQARLVVLITWDEGSGTTNHIPTLVVARTVRGLSSAAAYTHCSTLRLAEDSLGLPRLGCAATAASFRTGFRF
ncbi:MAG: alkaline phosphatase family protein [Actinomycetales bacterium]